jgi:hypothetical protein
VSLDLPVIMATVLYGAFFITIASGRRHHLRAARPAHQADLEGWVT